jgi:dihydrofolate reductase
MRLHDWLFATASWRRSRLRGRRRSNPGSRRGHHGSQHVRRWVGTWNEEWKGWWGDDPPYHAPAFVPTHHPRQPLTMHGGTTFTFVTDGIGSALEQAKAVAGEVLVSIAGGASTVRQYLAAGSLDELYLHIVPVILAAGERRLEDIGDPVLEPVKMVASPAVTHIKYRIAKRA